MVAMPNLSAISNQAQPVRYLDLLSRATAHVGDHLAEPLDTATLARQASMSPYHFHRLFRAYFGTTVAGYVTWRRLQRACELLGADDASVLEVALAVGYESAQALAKAMRRELDTTPTAVRAGSSPSWQRLFERRGSAGTASSASADTQLKPQLIDAPELWVLTATGRGMHDGDMTRAAQAGFAELWPAAARAGLTDRVKSCIAIFPDEPQDPNDQQARIWVGVIFDYALAERPAVLRGRPSTCRAAWHGTRCRPAATPCSRTSGRTATASNLEPAYGQWLPATGYALRDTSPFEHYVNDPRPCRRSSGVPTSTCRCSERPAMTAPPLTDLATAGAGRLAQALAAREVGALELCDAAIARIESGDRDINAVVVRDFERAREQARAADEALARGERRPLLGVPLTVKEAFNVAGLPTTWGFEFARHLPVAEDAVAVARLKAAGAVILGKTNCAFALADWQTSNPIYGRTVHPLDPSRTPGGSSGGGRGAGGGLVPLELGTDLVGSIRIPAHFCGLFGHKPSHGLVPRRGLDFPGHDGAHERPAGRHRPDGAPCFGPRTRARRAGRAGCRRGGRVSAGTPAAAACACRRPARAGGVHASGSGRVRRGACGGACRGRRSRASRCNGEPQQPIAAGSFGVARGVRQHGDDLRVHGQPGAVISAHDWLALLDERARVRAQCAKLFDTFDIVLVPAFGTTAFAHLEEPGYGRAPGDRRCRYTLHGARRMVRVGEVRRLASDGGTGRASTAACLSACRSSARTCTIARRSPWRLARSATK